MRSVFRFVLATAAIAASAACGGGGGSDPQGPNGNSNMSAQIDGDDWSGTGAAVRAAGGIYTFVGTGGNANLSVTLYNITTTGTYGLGVNATGFGGTGLVSTPNSGWSTPLTGVAGTITITTLTDTRIAGTFHYTAKALTGAAVGIKTVTDGEFDLPMTTSGTWTPPTAWAGSRLEGKVGSDTVVGATTAIVLNAGTLILTASDTSHAVTVTIQGLGAAGTYDYSEAIPVRRITVMDLETNAVMISDSTSPGAIILTTVNANRIVGTYSAAVKPIAGGSAVTVTGTFDYGIPHF